ncbi:Rad4-domain-containing protein [Parathielavia hyrcaniae]|uniref:Rad4-domain-containing protein n=1 Tax=Parathielavia hyrcaniae TaxID=113614 RepID=A0AAN6Q3Z2_9PEZI|nr:Rad4-domain-containing protein [Parathielavia hyrcaniae]
MLIEARDELTQNRDVPERPLKRRRPGEGRRAQVEAPRDSAVRATDSRTGLATSLDASQDDDVQFEDVVLPAPTVQTVLRDSDDDDEDDDIDFEDVAIEPAASSAAVAGEGSSKALNLDLSAHMAAAGPRRADRRKAINREEREHRVETHKVHLVCLLAHVELRNRWCNDAEVQDALRPLLPQKTVSALVPRASLNQFGRSESLKKGLQEAKELFKREFSITERGLWRALWAEDEEELKSYQLPDDMESTLDKSDFLEAAKTMQGSRDVGAQLFCALLRSVGVEARLVCSLQPLPFVPGAPSMPKQRKASTPQKQPSKAELYAAAVAKHETKFPEFQAGATTPPPRQRLGHPLATAYHIPSIIAPSHPPPQPSASSTPRKIRGESPFPVYWVEVLDVAHQKWHPVDPLVTHTQYKPRALEPPASDTLNNLTYAIAFASDSSAVDVTRRYAKAYTSKTRKQRIDNNNLPQTTTNTNTNTNNTRWYRLLLTRYTRPPPPTDLDQIERHELAAEEAREPMPRNVADFKDHPVYALERHLRRHEVLVPGAQPSGTVSAGTGARARAGLGAGAGAGVGAAPSRLERIYRRRDVRMARTKDKWFRLGRVVREGEEAVKSIPRRKRRTRRGVGSDDDDEKGDGDDDQDRVGLFGDAVPGYVPLYTEEQTDAYVAQPVVGGRVPKNKFGNVEVYVPSMVPRGGVHIGHKRAAQAAFILGVDYAPALTRFEFRGRQGTAVLNGAVVAEEAGEAIWAVIQGLGDLEAEEEQERRSRRALRMWSRFLKELRIRERIWAGVDAEAEAEAEGEAEGKGKGVVQEEGVEMGDVSEDDMGGGGFFVPDEDEEDDGGRGGFIVG